MVSYPLQILPHTDYLLPIVIDAVIAEGHGNVLVQRRSDCPELIAFEDGQRDSSKVTSHAFVNIAEMSMNLMGGLFKSERAYWSQKKPAHDNWDGKEVDPAKYLVSCEPTDPDAPLFYFKIASLHGLDFPHPRRGQKPKDMELYSVVNAVIEQFTGKDGKSFKGFKTNGKLFVNHVPTMMNYWHIQLELRSKKKDKEDSKEDKDSWEAFPKSRYEDVRRELVEALKNRIILDPEEVTLPEKFYKTSAASTNK